MSKIDELIREFCPEGVEYMQLGAIEDAGLIKLGRGNVISKKDIAAEPGDYPIYSSSASGVGEFGRYGKYMFDDERLSWSVDGGGRFFYRHAHKYSVTNVSGWLKVLDSSRIDIKYLFYALDSAWSTKKFDYTKKAHPSVIRNEYKIPIPPLEVQKEIASILDKFTELEAELSAELKARRKQYEYYRNQLLTFDESREDVRWLTLGDVATIKSGKNKNRKPEAEYPVFGSTGIIGYSDKYTYEGEVLLVARVGAYAGQVNRVNGKYDVSDNTLMIKLVDSCSYDYFYHLLVNMDLNQYASGGGQPLVTAGKLKELRIPVPELNEQNDIAEILGKFHKLTNDISEGLPAEINARRQQYEYYRTKLLTFQELAA